VPPGAANSQTAWRVSRTARRTAPQKLSSLQVPPGGINLTARRPGSSDPLLDSYRLALQTRPPGAAPPGVLSFPLYRLAEQFLPARRYTRTT